MIVVMRKITNPFVKLGRGSEYNCFACSPNNDIGLHLDFWEQDEWIGAHWQTRKNLEGWMGILHGGIQATLLDEIGGWVVMVKLKTAGVTTKMNVEYVKPLTVTKGRIVVKGRVLSVDKRIASIECFIEDTEGICYAKAEVSYFLFPERIAKAKYHYPGVEAFYD